jgi:hypothetical protein
MCLDLGSETHVGFRISVSLKVHATLGLWQISTDGYTDTVLAEQLVVAGSQYDVIPASTISQLAGPQ